MSSNIRITKNCDYCTKEFEAKTIKTRYCSHSCNSKAYKQEKRSEKINEAKMTGQNSSVIKIKNIFDHATLINKELLTIKETCAFLNITDVTLRRWLKDGIVHSSRVGKKHLIKKEHLNNLV